jgi:phospholipid/cholesterol/gamma-HCH transport system substrate-binding protein
MNFLQTIEFKVGLLVLVVGGLIAFMSLQVSDDPSVIGRAQRAWFLVPSASGLVKGSGVKAAGIPVGVIKDIRLQDGMARVEITVKGDLPLYSSAGVQIKSQGILGDRHVEVYPGSPTDPPLPANGQILNVSDKGNLDNLVSQVGEITGSLKSVAQALNESVTDDGTRKHILGRIVSNIEKVTEDLAGLTREKRGQLGDIVDQVDRITKTLDDMLNNEKEGGFRKTFDKSLARIDKSLKNIEEITSKINEGEGTLGKLISDETVAENVSEAIEGLSGMVGSANRLQAGFDFHGEYLGTFQATKSYIGVQIQPGLDRYYYIAVVDDPAGVVEAVDTTTTAESGAESTVREKKVYKNKTKLTVLFAKNFWDFTLRGGLIENSGGFGMDYKFLRRRLTASFEAFDLSKPNVKLSAKYDLMYGFYLIGGLSDALDKSSRRSGYIGAGLFLTNDDLKLLLASSPF